MILSGLGHLVGRDVAAEAELVSDFDVGSHCLICSLQFAVPQASPGAEVLVCWLFLCVGIFSDRDLHSIAVPTPKSNKNLKQSS